MDGKQSLGRVVVIGGVAAGASFAARLRRLSEAAEIVLVERGPDVSFANCGLPYYIGGEIQQRDALAVQTPASLHGLLNLNVRTRTEAVRIDAARKVVVLKDLASGVEEELSYDKLMLSPGAQPIRPPLDGIDDPRVHTLRNLEDMDRIAAAVDGGRRAVVIGAGFIGLEMAEQLQRRGMQVSVVELQPQVLPQLDREMAMLMESELCGNGINLVLGDGIAAFEPADDSLVCRLNSGKQLEADLVVLSIGVKPDTALARAAGLELGPRGHIMVDAYQRTSVADIYAAGDAVETADRVTANASAVPLGGPANRQGRVAADHIIMGDKARPYPGSLGTAIVRVFDVAAGLTSWSERRLQQANINYRATMVNDNHHAGYYPGAKPLQLKILWDADSGVLLGAQATGFEGVDKRLDVMATAIIGKLTVEDLCHLELSYAPPFGSAKDIVNLAGFAATNALDALISPVSELPQQGTAQLLDVRPKPLAAAHPLANSINIPFPELRKRMDELDRTQPVVTICAFGKMSYFAARILAQNGFNVASYSGGIKGRIDPRTPAKLPTP
jgi:NADPH-dependent 2,4-dienoyl-CoA reductase/sulfur reductase-like enzyme/rhodanese-related sulfurtransferase